MIAPAVKKEAQGELHQVALRGYGMQERQSVAGYFRISQARDDMRAPELYRDEIMTYCRHRRLDLTEIFSDIDFSAFRGAGPRPALEELKGRRREFSAVVVPKLSRFGRSVKDLITLFEQFEGDGVSLVFLDIGLDTSTSQGRLLRHIMSAFAEYESDVRADYFRAAQDDRARRGLPPTGWIAFGYKRSSGTYVIHEPHAAIVREIFELYSKGATMKSIARSLNARGIPSPRTKSWSKPTIAKFLDNHHYTGMLKHHGELRPGSWEPIVSRSLWDQVQARRLAITNRGVCPRRGLYLLSGLIECGVCGRILHHRTKQDRVPGQYVCRGDSAVGYCPGGGIAEHRAESFVVDAYLKRYRRAWVHDASVGDSPIPLVVLWEQALLERRRSMLASAIDRLVLVPKPAGNRRGVGLPRGRQLRVTWAVTEPQEVSAILPAPIPLSELSSRVCGICGRRRHITNFRLDPDGTDGRSSMCGRCRIERAASGSELIQRPSAPVGLSWSEWRRRRILPH
jgi:DNA invertase Pin-like site-specific DNA recombinase